MSTTVRKGTVTLAATALAGIAATGSAMAADDNLTIRYKSYMLDSTAAATDLYAAIESKVENYCDINGLRSPADHRIEAKCVATMLDKAVASIDNDRLSAIHEGRSTTSIAP